MTAPPADSAPGARRLLRSARPKRSVSEFTRRPWTLPDLRHKLASFLVARGASLPMIGAVLGHKSSQTTVRYAHLVADPLRALVDGATARFAVASDDVQEKNVVALKTS